MTEPQELSQLASEQKREMDRAGATFLLGLRRISHKDLLRAEAQARLDFAAAIIAMDEVDDRIAAGESIHSLNEQVAVEPRTPAPRRWPTSSAENMPFRPPSDP